MFDAAEQFLISLFTMERWPLWAATLVFTVIGQFTSTRLFTRERAYRDWGTPWAKNFWYWGRESLMLHPIAAGFVLGLVWRDPEGQGWPLIGSQMYFAVAGVFSLFLFVLLRGALKKRGIDLRFPGQSSRPPPKS